MNVPIQPPCHKALVFCPPLDPFYWWSFFYELFIWFNEYSTATITDWFSFQFSLPNSIFISHINLISFNCLYSLGINSKKNNIEKRKREQREIEQRETEQLHLHWALNSVGMKLNWRSGWESSECFLSCLLIPALTWIFPSWAPRSKSHSWARPLALSLQGRRQHLPAETILLGYTLDFLLFCC